MSNRLTEIKNRLAKATPGPWMLTRYSGGLSFNGPLRCYKGTDPEFGEPQSMPKTEDDHIFISHCPDDVAWLIQEVEILRALLEGRKGTVIGRQSQIQNLPRSAQEVIDQHEQDRRIKQLERDSEELSWLKNPDQMGK